MKQLAPATFVALMALLMLANMALGIVVAAGLEIVAGNARGVTA